MRTFAFAVLLGGCSAPNEDGTPANSPAHHTGNGFKNLYIEDPKKNFFDYMRMKYFGDDDWANHASRAAEVPVKSLDANTLTTPPEGLRLSWLGHSTFLLQTGNTNILTDPVFSDRASPLSFAGPKRYVRHVTDYGALPTIDYVVISHNHYDHLDRTAIERLGNAPVYLVPLGIKQWLVESGIEDSRVKEFDWWDEVTFSDMHVAALPSQHWSARGLGDRRETLWASWLLTLDARKIWFAGDTGYNSVQFAEIGQYAGGIDLALIPIGGYLPRDFMSPYHVDPLEALKIHKDVRSAFSVGMHWGTFPLTAEGPIDPVEELNRQKDAHDVAADAFVSIAIGETILLK